jgi:hypothetical protein
VSGSLDGLIHHDFRLDLLCCLVDGPLPIPALSARVGKPEAAVTYHLRLLEGREVVGSVGDEGDEDAVYAATLDKHPVWVAEAVKAHRAKDG